jgi:hypothetical protein
MSDAELQDLYTQHGSYVAIGAAIGLSDHTVGKHYKRRGITQTKISRGVNGLLTREALHAALLPPNNCKVKPFLDALDDEQRELVEEALAYDPKDLPAGTLRQLLIDSGYPEVELPGQDAIADHRKGRRPCRCKG